MNFATVCIIGILLGLAALFFVFTVQANLEWVHGKYGEKCYIKGTEHGNIKYPVYFDSRNDCLRDLAL